MGLNIGSQEPGLNAERGTGNAEVNGEMGNAELGIAERRTHSAYRKVSGERKAESEIRSQ